ncbi:peptidoglycan DD-metalloendopeptidase family protein [Colwellia asteriadis]|uniref:Peptidoglycan DD-metalloendopeptidase family protein n=1 Tax=Colwellia asteriadis TaxID=517723 RepID=A0ABP3WDM1_9GAMM
MKKILEVFSQLPLKHRIVIGFFSLLFLVFLLMPSNNSQDDVTDLAVGKRYEVKSLGNSIEHSAIDDSNPSPSNSKVKDLPSLASDNDAIERGTLVSEATKTINPPTPNMADEEPPVVELNWQTVKVRSGDSLARIFKRLGFSAQTTYAVSTAKGEDSKLLKKLNVGDELRIATNDTKQLAALEYPLSKTDTLYINLIGDTYQSSKEVKAVEIREAFSHGEISSSFWNAGVGAGLTDAQVINFANVFGWDIDFAQDIRAGDSFNVVYEQQYIDGEYIGTGNILAAEFVNQGEVFQAVRFSDNEYYTPDGKSMRKAFLRAPVNFKYISSSFKPRRFHPVQKRWKAHRGIDYAAKTGTPVVAAGNGKVTHAAYNKYNGHYVFIQHGNGIVTKYLHFSKRAVKKGQRVKQGEVIGYVGATGLAAGPHLHYEFLLNGVHRNPRTVKLPDAQPIAKKYKAEFQRISALRLQALAGARNALKSTQKTTGIASNNE